MLYDSLFSTHPPICLTTFIFFIVLSRVFPDSSLYCTEVPLQWTPTAIRVYPSIRTISPGRMEYLFLLMALYPFFILCPLYFLRFSPLRLESLFRLTRPDESSCPVLMRFFSSGLLIRISMYFASWNSSNPDTPCN